MTGLPDNVVVGVTALCAVLAGVHGGEAPSRSTVYRAIKAGLPVLGKNRAGKQLFDGEAACRWWLGEGGVRALESIARHMPESSAPEARG